ncbi:Phosphate permease [Mycena sanguinolenta]|uniref:Phosphate permease n=1 Tax=Mycena sanguinolenta TaxID=230812 RepID=A0A8H7CK75_9AGAR|nr:Phosphate permease [Mycena sanguinolenta]
MADNDDASSRNSGPKPDGVQRLNELRIALLREVDEEGWTYCDPIKFHRNVCLVAGVGFFTDAYDLFAINIASTMLGYVYGHDHDSSCRPKLNLTQDLALKIATPVGTFFGQLFFGWFADIVGRKPMYGAELILMIVGTFSQATAGGGADHKYYCDADILAVHYYPISATISSEFAPTRFRGQMMTSVFAAQGWGNLAASIVAIVITVIFKGQISRDFPPGTCFSPSTLDHIDYLWRLLIGLGCVPGVIALYFRLKIPETPRFTMDVKRNVARAMADINGALHPTRGPNRNTAEQRADGPRATFEDFRNFFGKRDNFLKLFGAAYSWMAIDVAFYTLGLNSSIIFEAINFGASADVWETLYNICKGNLILSLAGLIPGYWVCFLFIETMGRKRIQLMGFAVLTVLFVVMAASFKALIPDRSPADDENVPAKTIVFVFLFCLANFFQNFGPNTTSFVLAGEIFPTRYRATAHGICAATGKLGAIFAQVIFRKLDPSSSRNKLALSFGVLSIFTMTGVFSTLLVPETKGESLEVLSNESQEGFMRAPQGEINVQDGIVIPLERLDGSS